MNRDKIEKKDIYITYKSGVVTVRGTIIGMGPADLIVRLDSPLKGIQHSRHIFPLAMQEKNRYAKRGVSEYELTNRGLEIALDILQEAYEASKHFICNIDITGEAYYSCIDSCDSWENFRTYAKIPEDWSDDLLEQIVRKYLTTGDGK